MDEAYLTKLKEFRNLETEGFTEVQCTAALRVYLELTQVRQMYKVDTATSAELNIVYLVAYEKEDGPAEIYIPHLEYDSFNFYKLLDYQKSLTTTNKIYIAICHPDSTIVYYKFTKGEGNFLDQIKPLENNTVQQ